MTNTALRTYVLTLILTISVWTPPAEASATVNHTGEHFTSKRAAEVLQILTAYSQICDSGCKYRAPSLVQMFVVSYQREKNSYYTWSDIEDVKDSEFFSRVTINDRGNGHITMVTSVLDPSDKNLGGLKKASGKDHGPLSDSGMTRFEIVEVFGADGKFQKTRVQQIQKITVSGLYEMFTSQIRDGMARAAEATFGNIGR